MNTILLREQVIDKIYGINDVGFLQAIKKILESATSSDKIYYLNDEQRSAINISRRQIADGDYVTNEELEAEEAKWLNE